MVAFHVERGQALTRPPHPRRCTHIALRRKQLNHSVSLEKLMNVAGRHDRSRMALLAMP